VIDFRYHVVSLVSVFLALAVGIVLGAGPLNEGISTGITDQVQQLTEEKNQLRTERDEALTATESQDTWAQTVAPALVGRQLGGRTVAVVELPGADSSQVDEAVQMLETAGATVSAQVTVQETWTDEASADDRDDVAASLSGQLTTAPATDAGTEELLAAGLAQALVTSELAQTDQPAQGASGLLGTLSDAGLVEVEGGVDAATTRATLALVIGGPTDVDASADQLEAQNTAWVALAAELDRASAGAVLAGPAGSAADGGPVAALRADTEVADAVSSVDDVDSPIGQVSSVLALRQQLSGDSGHYGTADSASAISPPLPAVAP